jgi:hypothetical protein
VNLRAQVDATIRGKVEIMQILLGEWQIKHRLNWPSIAVAYLCFKM